MMPTGLFSQISLILLSIAIVVLYVNPKLEAIKSTQDNITIYQEEYSKVSEVTEQLKQKFSELDAISVEDRKRLLTFMPDTVDTVVVPRDIKAIADGVGVALNRISYAGPVATSEDTTTLGAGFGTAPLRGADKPEQHVFAVEFTSSYNQIKQFLIDVERNAYPLEVHDLVIDREEEGLLSVQMKIITYDREVEKKSTDGGTPTLNQLSS